MGRRILMKTVVLLLLVTSFVTYAQMPASRTSKSDAEKIASTMQAGPKFVTQNATVPHDTTSPPIPIGPHWMIMWPFDPKSTGLPTTHKPAGAYIMWAGSPYAHVHVMGRP
jgi:hypothetical protein